MTVELERVAAATEDSLAARETWDQFVASSGLGSYLQTAAWAAVKATNGWAAHRLMTATADGPVGAQVLSIRVRPSPWRFGYAPRGPVATIWTSETVAAISERLRRDPGLRRLHVSHVRIDPPIERPADDAWDTGLRHALRLARWRSAPPVQPGASRVIDLAADETAVWGDLRSKWRQYVGQARRRGIRVSEADGERLGDFYRIIRETAKRTGILIRTEQAYRDVWNAFRPAGMARLLFAEDPDGAPQAALFLVRCGGRVVEPYGGMTAAGAATRANYLLKWEAIRSSRATGATSYDMWGLIHTGIDQFKAGFGGREVRYIGAWDLVLDPVGYAVTESATRLRSAYVDLIRRRGRPGALNGRHRQVTAP